MKSGRTPLTFSVIGMAAREAMLLKSFVRMLDSRTKQRWVYKAQQDSHEQQAADLTFLGDEGEPADAVAPATASPPARQLRMGVLALDVYAKLDRPLRPDELERELNRMGKLLVAARMQSASTLNSGSPSDVGALASHQENTEDGKRLYIWQLPEKGSTHSEFVLTNTASTEFAGTIPATLTTLPPVTTQAVVSPAPAPAPVLLPQRAPAPEKALHATLASAVSTLISPTDKLRMLRWPHATLVNTPARLKLAAFMASGSNTLENLQHTSGQSIKACTEFVQDLHASGFLSVTPLTPLTPVQADKAAAPRPSPGHAAPAASAPTATRHRKPEPSSGPHAANSRGLFARIRARLGISLAG